ncbi:MAG: hypothetical protein COZ16_01780 [Flavobacteriaceae bacterium CG_4_10_14_3_um_filter_31_253]|nr:MAG: hypothetical protein AUK46_00730 [Flavobacteriaceae bacterium CG2_30_31_66]PIV95574.1 MAG: hypothetical protein COW43_12685 [Flavobacteriaceae bacterium CG17_big_fil_post_rev_8_21_14_2_50_31_13]PIX12771.1 MAG: hypothetical protein COZ74_09820 [Flavobacteriaceae bacterium CG_4_8_14_3_um_filter_31_8]PIY15953.1 MAG: hypothetical protein COZ16_01780 [Flavobacteriaceae bacterium CG_4_10_14_3_um_filter_31_253]PIZ11519.1 MAG: hypothetical protein COY55_04095 [Flavobacteriaceae bacterium CG_4_1
MLFAIAFSTNANNKIEIVNIITKDEINFDISTSENVSNEIFEEELIFGCGDLGNAHYEDLVAGGMSHREARSNRRATVRECRGNGPDGWLSIFISWAN